MNNDIADMLDQLKHGRPYAGFFEGSNKSLKELGVAKFLFDSLSEKQEAWFNKPRRFNPDPPDCVAFDKNMARTAIEVTELVSEKAIKANIAGRKVLHEAR